MWVMCSVKMACSFTTISSFSWSIWWFRMSNFRLYSMISSCEDRNSESERQPGPIKSQCSKILNRAVLTSNSHTKVQDVELPFDFHDLVLQNMKPRSRQ